MKTRLTQDLLNRIKAGNTPAARYVGTYSHLYGEYNYLMGRTRGISVARPDDDHRERDALSGRGSQPRRQLRKHSELDREGKPVVAGSPVEVQVDLDTESFYKMLVDLLTAPTPESQVERA